MPDTVVATEKGKTASVSCFLLPIESSRTETLVQWIRGSMESIVNCANGPSATSGNTQIEYFLNSVTICTNMQDLKECVQNT